MTAVSAHAPRREAVVDLDALRHNLRCLVEASGTPCVEVTADAYGHGLLPVARAAVELGAELGVHDDATAELLRAAGLPAATRPWGSGPRSPAEAGSGLAAYGFASVIPGLRPVMTLTAPLANVKRVGRGQGVSYGLTYRTESETTLALVPLGYADGIPRAAGGAAEVWVGGVRHPVAGRIAMDQIVLDVGDASVSPGDLAVVFGPGDRGEPTALDWAGYASTSVGEILSRVGPRVRRRYLGLGAGS